MLPHQAPFPAIDSEQSLGFTGVAKTSLSEWLSSLSEPTLRSAYQPHQVIPMG